MSVESAISLVHAKRDLEWWNSGVMEEWVERLFPTFQYSNISIYLHP
jgi:hypothetical protein